MAAHKAPASSRPRCTRGGNFVATIPVCRLYRSLGGSPGPIWMCAKNLVPTGIQSPDNPARSQSLYQLKYPARGHRYALYEAQLIDTVLWRPSLGVAPFLMPCLIGIYTALVPELQSWLLNWLVSVPAFTSAFGFVLPVLSRPGPSRELIVDVVLRRGRSSYTS
jgi:hypothetical protein